VQIVLKSGSLNLLEPSRLVKVCNGIALRFTEISELKFTLEEAIKPQRGSIGIAQPVLQLRHKKG
jgi:hypothetical protein